MAKSGGTSIFHFDIGRISYRMVLATLAALLFAIYGPRVSTEVPDIVRVFFENSLARFAMIVLIIYIGNQNLELSVFIAVVIILVMSFVHKYDLKESLTNKIHEDFYSPSAAREHFGIDTRTKQELLSDISSIQQLVQQSHPQQETLPPATDQPHPGEAGGQGGVNSETPAETEQPEVVKLRESPTVEQFQSGFARTMDAVIEHTH